MNKHENSNKHAAAVLLKSEQPLDESHGIDLDGEIGSKSKVHTVKQHIEKWWFHDCIGIIGGLTDQIVVVAKAERDQITQITIQSLCCYIWFGLVRSDSFREAQQSLMSQQQLRNRTMSQSAWNWPSGERKSAKISTR
jgi:hypothetical protein